MLNTTWSLPHLAQLQNTAIIFDKHILIISRHIIYIEQARTVQETFQLYTKLQNNVNKVQK